MDSNLIGGSCKHREFFTCYYCKNDKLSADNKALREELVALKQSIPKIRADAIRDMLKCVLRISDGFSHDLIGRIKEHANKIEAE